MTREANEGGTEPTATVDVGEAENVEIHPTPAQHETGPIETGGGEGDEG